MCEKRRRSIQLARKWVLVIGVRDERRRRRRCVLNGGERKQNGVDNNEP